jgi:hypothetical protein
MLRFGIENVAGRGDVGRRGRISISAEMWNTFLISWSRVLVGESIAGSVDAEQRGL